MTTSKLNILKECVFILVLSIILALVFNFFSDSGIPLVRFEKELKWESDSLLNRSLAYSSEKLDSVKNPIGLKSELSYRSSNQAPVAPKQTIVEGIPKNLTENNDNLKSIVRDTIKVSELDSVKASEKTFTKPTATAITITQAYKIFNSTGAVFIDARTESEFNLGHIKGAINIPLKRFDLYKDKLNKILKAQLIVSYCDGRGCDLSIELAEKIIEYGFINVKIFYGGWMDWKEMNYPIEK